MNKWAIIENGKVVNVILWDGESPWEAKAGQSVVKISEPENGEQEPGIGWVYINKEFIPPIDLNTD